MSARLLPTIVLALLLVAAAVGGIVERAESRALGAGRAPGPSLDGVRAHRVPTTVSAPVTTTTTAPVTTTTTTTTVPPEPSGPTPRRGDGTLTVAPGTSAVVGDGTLRRFTVEVEGGIGYDAGRVAADVEATLFHDRSWAGGPAGGTPVAFQRVDAGPVDVRVVLASPETTDQLCAPLRTNGLFSCLQGNRAVINLMRWREGAPASGLGLADYRHYVVNHEVGHALGHGHPPCPGSGRPAPVMMQQTKGIGACTPNAWPLPTELSGP